VSGVRFSGSPWDELTRAKPSLAPVRWLHRQPSTFWDLPECEFGRALAEHKLMVRREAAQRRERRSQLRPASTEPGAYVAA
jgi:hypothetical protein